MDVRFIASFAVISADLDADRQLFLDDLGLALRPPESVDDVGYLYTEDLDGAKHFGLWPLAEAADACFGRPTWPDDLPVPQAGIEFEVDDVPAAARELVERGHRLLHDARTEPWGQVVARVLSPGGLVIGVSHTPHLRED